MYYIITNNSDELYHYGVKGMHWGVRRYQNYDGTRIGTGGEPVRRNGAKLISGYKKSVAGGQGGTAKGTARVAAIAGHPGRLDGSDSNDGGSGSNDKKGSGLFDRTIRNGKGRENTSPAEEMTKGVRDISRNAKPLVDVAEKHDPKVKESREKYSDEAKKMTDKELRDSINRIKMEREYADLKSADIETGYDKAREYLEIAGDVASILLTVASFIAIVSKLRHEDLDPETVAFIEDFSEVLAQDGLTIDDISPDFLEHHGIKGQKWGVRRFQDYDGSRIGGGGSKASNSFRNSIVGGQGGKATGTARLAASSSFGQKQSKIRSDGKDESKFTPEQKRISNDARKDAEEFARAKAFYGEGAGNRRKAIKTTVEAKKKKSDFYNEEFEYHLSQQDMEEHMRKAKIERSQKDTAKNTRSALRKTNRALGQLSRYL